MLVSLILAIVFLGCSTRGVQGVQRVKKQDDGAKVLVVKKTSTNSRYIKPSMRPYSVAGVKYYPHYVDVGSRFKGVASWYGSKFQGKLTSNGEKYNMYEMTAAHKTFPMNTLVKVTNLRNNRSVIVRINDRGPFVKNRLIDLSKKAASQIGMMGRGTTNVIIEVLDFEKQTKIKKPKKDRYNGSYVLQIASFANIDGAIKTQERYNNTDGYQTIIKDVEINGVRLYKVCLKGFRDEQEVRDYKDNSEFENSFILKESFYDN